MHDRCAYERLKMALHDHPVHRFLATGIAGLSVAVDGDYPAFGNNDDRADDIAAWLVRTFMEKVRAQPTYRGAEPSLSVLTITSNVVYGKHTGNTPDGRRGSLPLQRASRLVLHRHAPMLQPRAGLKSRPLRPLGGM